MRRSQPYKIGFNERLRDPEYAAAYLNAARRESHEVFLLALRDVAEVHKFSKVAAAAALGLIEKRSTERFLHAAILRWPRSIVFWTCSGLSVSFGHADLSM